MLNDPVVRGRIYQVSLLAFLVVSVWWIVDNTITNLKASNIASGFDFLWARAGFDILIKPIEYTPDDTHGRAFMVGLINTLIIAVLGIIISSIIGFLVGVARLSKNWLLSKAALVYVEIFRNIPLLLQLLFWYKAVLSVLPGPKQGIIMPLGSNLSNRGLITPRLVTEDGASFILYAAIIAAIAWIALARWAKQRQAETGQIFPAFRVGLGLLIGLPLLTYFATGMPLTVEYPAFKGFNFVGGFTLPPELMALLVGISIYTSTYIAEVVRGGILAVSYGQTEAASALGISNGLAMRLVVVPQAMRVIIPPLTSQYLNLTKNSSLAVAVGYPDLVAVFAGSTLNITSRALEVVFMTMAVYLALSLLTAAFMNWFNARVALVER